MQRFYGKGIRNDELTDRYYYQQQQQQQQQQMRYADPWLYESNVLPKSTIFLAPFHQIENAAVATASAYYQPQTLVLCTCKEYVTGTRKASKKQQTSVTVCKKCKGARLPLIGGTTCAKRFLKNNRSGLSSSPSLSSSTSSSSTFNLNRLTFTSGISSTRSRSNCSGTVRSLVDYCVRPSLWTLFNEFPAQQQQQHYIPETSQQLSSITNRKSILECNINPYELVSDNITEINGQRIVLKSLKAESCGTGEWETEPDLEPETNDEPDETKPKVQIKKCFKSILKRPVDSKTITTPAVSTATGPLANNSKQKLTARTLSRIPVAKTTANFYLPLPTETDSYRDDNGSRNVPKNRKKVQFLDNDEEDDGHDGTSLLLKPKIVERPRIAPPPPPRLTPSPKLSPPPPPPPPPPPLPPSLPASPPKPSVRQPPPPPPPPPPQPPSQPETDETPKPPPRRKYQNQQTQTISTPPPPIVPKSTVVYLKTTDDSPVSKPEPLVHKLEIKHEDDSDASGSANNHSLQSNSNQPKTATSSLKTSILINGDNCYSTVNVSNNVPLYQSSVIVKGTTQFDDDDVGDNCLQTNADDEDAVSLADTLVPQDFSNNDELVTNSDQKIINDDDDDDGQHSFYEAIDHNSDSYSNRSSITEEDITSSRSKFYEMLAETELSTISDHDQDSYTNHQYEIIKTPATNQLIDPIYEDIEVTSGTSDDEAKSIFEGASKYDILSYLASAKERGVLVSADEAYSTISLSENGDLDDETDPNGSNSWSPSDETGSDGVENGSDSGVVVMKTTEIERNDSGIGSESSKTSRSRYQLSAVKATLCEDCDGNVDKTITNPDPGNCCWRCSKKRNERKDIIREIVETEEKYGRDLQIILEEFYQPMMVAGLLSSEQLAAIFLNVDELLENSVGFAAKMRSSIADANESNDNDWLTVNMGRIFLDATANLHAFERYCVRQSSASLLLASLEKEKELLRIFLQVSQMENTLLRRMNLNSFLMVPVQRVTKYPLLLSRLCKVTSASHQQEHRTLLRDAQLQVELHLSHINSETKDVPGKLWRRSRVLNTELDLTKIKLRKLAIDILEWNHEHAQFVLETKLFYTQPTDHQWRKGRLIKLNSINALLVTNQKTPTKTTTSADQSKDTKNQLALLQTTNRTRETALVLIRDKNGRYSLLRDPLYLDRCIVATDPAWQHYFEVQEIIGSKDTYVFKGDNNNLTQLWYRTLQMHCQGMGAWRKRRNALPNIMIYGMNSRTPT